MTDELQTHSIGMDKPEEHHYGDEDPASTAHELTHCRANSDYSRFRSVAQKVVNQQAKLDQLRQDVDVLRDGANYAWECKKHQCRFVQSSMDKFVKAATAMLVEVPAGHSLEGLNKLLVQVQGDIKVVTEQIDSSTAAEETLGNKQYCLREREQKFAAAVQETLRTLSDQGIHTRPTSEISSPNSTSQVDAASSIHPLLERYFASVADLDVLEERLADLQTEFEQERINRQLRQDQGQSPEHPDEEFSAAYTKQIQDAASVLTDAEKELAYLQEECDKEGFQAAIKAISPPMSADAHANGQSETSEEALPSLHPKDRTVSSDMSPNRICETYLRGAFLDDSLSHGALARSRSRVDGWLRQESGTTGTQVVKIEMLGYRPWSSHEYTGNGS